MYTSQSGFYPVFTRFIGNFFVIVSVMFLFYWGVQVPKDTLLRGIINIARILLLATPFLLAGIFVSGIFPDIRIDPDGISFRYLQFFKGKIKWAEIYTMKRFNFPTTYFAIFINREGYHVLNYKGLWVQSIYGTAHKSDLPVILIADTKIYSAIQESEQESN